jgi:hypothetical protein
MSIQKQEITREHSFPLFSKVVDTNTALSFIGWELDINLKTSRKELARIIHSVLETENMNEGSFSWQVKLGWIASLWACQYEARIINFDGSIQAKLTLLMFSWLKWKFELDLIPPITFTFALAVASLQLPAMLLQIDT